MLYYTLFLKRVCTVTLARAFKTGCMNKIICVLLPLQDQAPGVELIYAYVVYCFCCTVDYKNF